MDIFSTVKRFRGYFIDFVVMHKKGVVKMSTVDKIFELLEAGDYQQKDLTDYLGLDKGVSSQWKTGKSKSYRKYLPEIAAFFNISVSELLDEKDAKKVVPFSDDEEWNEYIDMYKSFSPSDRDLVLGFMKGLAAKNESDK